MRIRIDWLSASVILFGLSLSLLNQKIGWASSGGPNWSALALRPDIWVGIGALMLIARSKKMYVAGLNKHLLIKIPLWFIGLTILASLINGILEGEYITSLGILDISKCLIALITGLAIYEFSVREVSFARIAKNIFILMPIIAVGAALYFLISGMNYVPNINEARAGQGGGIIAYGGRLQGLSSNPNIVATTICISISMIIPDLIEKRQKAEKRFVKLLYAVILISLMLWTGVRAAIVSLVITMGSYIWLKFKLKRRTIGRVLIIVLSFMVAVAVITWITGSFGPLSVMGERLTNSEDGRLWIWRYYSEILIDNPFGLGLGYENIVDVDPTGQNLRLTPHNTFLLAGIYAGLGGLIVNLQYVHLVIKKIYKSKKVGWMSTDVTCLVLGWISLLVNMVFGGLMLGDYSFVCLTALILAALEGKATSTTI